MILMRVGALFLHFKLLQADVYIPVDQNADNSNNYKVKWIEKIEKPLHPLCLTFRSQNNMISDKMRILSDEMHKKNCKIF